MCIYNSGERAARTICEANRRMDERLTHLSLGASSAAYKCVYFIVVIGRVVKARAQIVNSWADRSVTQPDVGRSLIKYAGGG